MTNSKIPPNYGDSKLFYPGTIIVTPQARASPPAKDLIREVRNKAPDVELIYSHDQRPQFPPGINNLTQKYFYSKDAITLSERTDQFIETFASPGHIIEEPCTIVKTLSQCCNSCHYCYLQKTAIRHPRQRIYVNLQYLEREMINETALHPAWMSLLSIVSFHEKKVLQKIPSDFKSTSDRLRVKLSKKGKALLTENMVKLYFRDNLKEILPVFGISIDSQNLKGYIAQFMEFYEVNKSYPLWFNISEYSDIVSSNHLHHQLERFFDIVERNENINIQFFTKSANLDSLLESFSGNNRIRIILNLSTDHVQRKYEEGTSSLSERLRIAEKIQKSSGYRLVLHLEPIIKYPGYEEEYLDLMRTLMTRLDPKKLDGVTLGSIRYAGNLISVIKKNYPETDLFSAEQGLVKPKHRFDRYRYPLQERVKVYSLLIDEIRKHTDVPVRFGAETPELWEAMGFDAEEFLRKYFYQYPGDENTTKKIREKNLNEDNLKELKQMVEHCFSQGLSVYAATIEMLKKQPVGVDEESLTGFIRDEYLVLARNKFTKANTDGVSIINHKGKSCFHYKLGSNDLYMDLYSKDVYLSMVELEDSIMKAETSEQKLVNLIQLKGKTAIERMDIISILNSFLIKFISLKSECHYTLLSVYILLSYVYNSFHVIPYIKLKGQKGTGKTTVLMVLEALMNNAVMASSITPAALFRIMDEKGNTLLIDEAESLRERKSSTEGIFEVLNSGYNAAGQVVRVIQGEVRKFQTFGPKVIASINNLAPATEDRTIIVETDQTKETGLLESFIKDKIDEVHSLRTSIFSLLPELLRRIPEEVKAYRPQDFSPDLKGRHNDRWMSILILTKILSGEKKKHLKAVKEAIEKDITLKTIEDRMSPEKMALEVLSEVVNDKNTRRINSSDEYICIEAALVSEAIIQADVQRHFTNQGHVTRFLTTRGVIVDRRRVDNYPTTLYKIPMALTGKK